MEPLNDSTAESPISPLGNLALLGQSQPVEMPSSLLGRVAAATRPDLALALTMPAIYGAVMGWWQTGQFSWLTFIFLLTGVLSSALGYQLLSTVYDYRQSLEPQAGATDDLPTMPFAWLAGGALPPGLLLSAGWLLLSLGGMSALWLTLLSGWPLLFFTGLSILLILASFLPPVRYAARGWGVGELGLTLGFGVLPLLAGYYTQTAASLSWLPVAAGAPLALLVFLLVFTSNLGAWRRDWRMGKRTLPVLLGVGSSVDLAAGVTMGAYTAILFVTILSRLPLWGLTGLATLPLALGVYSDLRRNEIKPEEGYHLRDMVVKATIWTGVLLCLALWISRAG